MKKNLRSRAVGLVLGVEKLKEKGRKLLSHDTETPDSDGIDWELQSKLDTAEKQDQKVREWLVRYHDATSRGETIEPCPQG